MNDFPDPEEDTDADADRLKTVSQGFVYFVQSFAGGPVKVGTADDPKRRLCELQTGNPMKLRILATVAGGRPLEKQLHQALGAVDGTHVRAEWFNPTEGFLQCVGRILGDQFVFSLRGDVIMAKAWDTPNPEEYEALVRESREEAWQRKIKEIVAGLRGRSKARS